MTQPHLQPAPAAASGAGADITLVNLNMLFVRYYDKVERELHVPLGTLYLTASLEQAGLAVDFRDYQLCPAEDPFARRPSCGTSPIQHPSSGSRAWRTCCPSPSSRPRP